MHLRFQHTPIPWGAAEGEGAGLGDASSMHPRCIITSVWYPTSFELPPFWLP